MPKANATPGIDKLVETFRDAVQCGKSEALRWSVNWGNLNDAQIEQLVGEVSGLDFGAAELLLRMFDSSRLQCIATVLGKTRRVDPPEILRLASVIEMKTKDVADVDRLCLGAIRRVVEERTLPLIEEGIAKRGHGTEIIDAKLCPHLFAVAAAFESVGVKAGPRGVQDVDNHLHMALEADLAAAGKFLVTYEQAHGPKDIEGGGTAPRPKWVSAVMETHKRLCAPAKP